MNITDKLAASLEQTLATVKLYTGHDVEPTSIRAGQIRDAEAALAEYRAHPATKLRHHVTGTIERGEGEAIVELQRFTVIAVSANMNSFGFKSIILLNEQGETWEILKSPYAGEELPKQGDLLERVGGRFAISHECPRRLKDSSPAVARKVIADATKK